jgi:PAS domain S-box-containing protein
MSETSKRPTRPSLDYEGQQFPTLDERRAAWQREFSQTTGAFSLAFQHAAIGMAIVDLDGKFLKLNRAFCKIVGYDEEALLKLDFQSITHPEDLDADVALARQLRDGEIDRYDLEKRYFHRDGSTIWIELSASMMRDENGQPFYFISQIQDITARKQAQRESARRLRHLERLTQTASQLLRDVDDAPNEAQYENWLSILLESFGSRVGMFLRVDRDEVLFGPYMHESRIERMRFRPIHRPDLWQEAINSCTVVAENRAQMLEGDRLVTRSLVGPISHEGSLVGLIHLSDAPSDYDADDCDLLARVIRMIAPMMHARLKRDILTPREQEVMEMLVSGMSQKQIAQELNISVQTAAKHRSRVLDKLKLQNDVELTHLALQMRRPAGLASV